MAGELAVRLRQHERQLLQRVGFAGTMRRTFVGLWLLGAVAAGCTAAPGHPLTGGSPTAVDVSPSPDGTPSATLLPASYPPTSQEQIDLPIDPGIEPVSVSRPSVEAAEALRLCQVLDLIGADKVGGMGRIPRARDVVRYVKLVGVEPEIQSDEPAWIVQFQGEVPMPMNGEIWIDPTCIVVGTDGGFYATGPVRNVASGAVYTPLPSKQMPEFALPPLLP